MVTALLPRPPPSPSQPHLPPARLLSASYLEMEARSTSELFVHADTIGAGQCGWIWRRRTVRRTHPPTPQPVVAGANIGAGVGLLLLQRGGKMPLQRPVLRRREKPTQCACLHGEEDERAARILYASPAWSPMDCGGQGQGVQTVSDSVTQAYPSSQTLYLIKDLLVMYFQGGVVIL